MFVANRPGPLEVCDGSAHTKHSIVAARAERKLLNRGFEERSASRVEHAVLAKARSFKLTVEYPAGSTESLALPQAGVLYARTDRGRVFSASSTVVARRRANGRNFDDKIDTILQRPGNAARVSFDLQD